MSVRFYQTIWLLFIGTAATFLITGNLTPIVGVVFGFIVFGLIFMGMMSVLPTSITHPVPSNERLGSGLWTRIRTAFESGQKHLTEWRSTWMSSGSIEVGRPKFH